jgi:hypothetical protein
LKTGATLDTAACPTGAETDPRKSIFLPILPHYGPLTLGDARRVLALQLAMLAVALGTFILSDDSTLRALSVGLTFPGAGFLYQGNLLAFGLSLVAFLSVLPLILGGLWVLPSGVVLLSALGASHGAGQGAGAGWTLAAWSLLPVWLIALQAWRRRTESVAKVEREDYNRWVQSVDIAEIAPWRNARIDPAEELTPEALGRARQFFDLALQPIDSYNGYDMIEQKATAALRYQYTFPQYLMALMQYSYAPAFTGYLTQAQRNLITRMQAPINWRYFVTLERFAYWQFQPNPINVIGYSGYLGTMIGMYTKLHGDGRYDVRGSIQFRYSDRYKFDYDLRGMCEDVAELYRADRYHCVPCEPAWYYPFCNSIGMQQLMLGSELYEQRWAEELLPLYRKALLDEFVMADGRITTMRHRWLGVRVPFFDFPTMEFLNAYLTAPVVPDITERSWAASRRRHFPSGGYAEKSRLADHDIGNYNFRSRITPRVTAMLLANEMGDLETVERMREEIAREAVLVDRDGATHIDGASVATQALLTIVETSHPKALTNLLRKPHTPATLAGPVLAEVPYPDVLVAKARTNGESLSLVLHPGRPHSGESVLGFAQLKPGHRYRLAVGGSDSVVASDENGRVSCLVAVRGRTPVELRPAAH